jgi:hypothetical protein
MAQKSGDDSSVSLEDELCATIVKQARDYAHRDVLLASDLFFDMVPLREGWGMTYGEADDICHPMCALLMARTGGNGFLSMSDIAGQDAVLIVWREADVKQCVRSLMEKIKVA